MPKTPDFEKIARAVAEPHCDLEDEDGEGNIVDVATSADTLAPAIADALRLVWNARGAADIAKVETEGHGATLKALTSALLSLDR